MTNTCTLTLKREDVLQILDALTERLSVWRNTAQFLRGEAGEPDFPALAESDKAQEADLVAQHYADIISTIHSQASPRSL